MGSFPPCQGTTSKRRGHTYPPEPLTAAEVQALLRAIPARSSTGLRNRAIVALLYGSGLRVTEALALKPADLDPETGSLQVLRGKGNKRREVGLDPSAATIVERWRDRRQQLGFTGWQPLLCTFKGDPLSSNQVRAMLRRYAVKAGITKRVHPHGLRHTFAYELDREGVSVREIQQALGHSSLEATARYLGSIGAPQVLKTIRARTRTIE